ncbi:hypothetical protein HYQ46_003094 [Verticillium longisporum]|nr:hypothetical protein HYQ46_003094 [Verticillium longisporum]
MNPHLWGRHSLPRQLITTFLLTWTLTTSFYLCFGGPTQQASSVRTFAPSTGELADMSAIQLCDTHAVLSICVSSSGSVDHEFGHLCLQLYLANVGCCSGDCLLHSQCMDVLTAR